jgi:hypothetical protein
VEVIHLGHKAALQGMSRGPSQIYKQNYHVPSFEQKLDLFIYKIAVNH